MANDTLSPSDLQNYLISQYGPQNRPASTSGGYLNNPSLTIPALPSQGAPAGQGGVGGDAPYGSYGNSGYQSQPQVPPSTPQTMPQNTANGPILRPGSPADRLYNYFSGGSNGTASNPTLDALNGNMVGRGLPHDYGQMNRGLPANWQSQMPHANAAGAGFHAFHHGATSRPTAPMPAAQPQATPAATPSVNDLLQGQGANPYPNGQMNPMQILMQQLQAGSKNQNTNAQLNQNIQNLPQNNGGLMAMLARLFGGGAGPQPATQAPQQLPSAAPQGALDGMFANMPDNTFDGLNT